MGELPPPSLASERLNCTIAVLTDVDDDAAAGDPGARRLYEVTLSRATPTGNYQPTLWDIMLPDLDGCPISGFEVALTDALARGAEAPPEVRADAVTACIWLAYRAGDYDATARALYEQSAELVPLSTGPASRMWRYADLSSGPRNPRCCASAGPSMLTRSRS